MNVQKNACWTTDRRADLVRRMTIPGKTARAVTMALGVALKSAGGDRPAEAG
jgi:hypothetical protein